MTPQVVWIVGNITGTADDGQYSWEFAGVFDTQAAALAACRDAPYFIGPARMNEPRPAETTPWQGAYYPQVQDGPTDG